MIFKGVLFGFIIFFYLLSKIVLCFKIYLTTKAFKNIYYAFKNISYAFKFCRENKRCSQICH